MTDDELGRRFARMLSELEDAEVALVTRQSELSHELADVNAQLDRLASVKRVMLGQDAPKRRRKADTPEGRTQAVANREVVAAWLNGRENAESFSAQDAATATGLPTQGLGPILTGMARRGLVEVVGTNDDGRKLYRRAGAE